MPRCPLTSRLELGARPTAVPCARMITRQVIREWGLPDLVDTAELLVSELVTNAIRASSGLPEPTIRLWLVSDRSTVPGAEPLHHPVAGLPLKAAAGQPVGQDRRAGLGRPTGQPVYDLRRERILQVGSVSVRPVSCSAAANTDPTAPRPTTAVVRTATPAPWRCRSRSRAGRRRSGPPNGPSRPGRDR